MKHFGLSWGGLAIALCGVYQSQLINGALQSEYRHLAGLNVEFDLCGTEFNRTGGNTFYIMAAVMDTENVLVSAGRCDSLAIRLSGLCAIFTNHQATGWN